MADPDPKALFRAVLAEMTTDGSDLGTIDEALPALTAFVAEYAAPDFVCVMRGLPPTPPLTYPGIEGVAEAWNDYGSAFERVRAELEEVRESESHIVVFVNQVAITRHGGVEISQPSAMVWSFADGRVARLEFHLDRDAALRAGGLDPANPGAPL